MVVVACVRAPAAQVHHPAQGVFLEPGGSTVVLYVHENVPGVTSDVTPTASQMAQFPYLRLPRPRLVRHTIPADALRRWTAAALGKKIARAGRA